MNTFKVISLENTSKLEPKFNKNNIDWFHINDLEEWVMIEFY